MLFIDSKIKHDFETLEEEGKDEEEGLECEVEVDVEEEYKEDTRQIQKSIPTKRPQQAVQTPPQPAYTSQ
jgi:hypothetical protein